MPRLPLIALLVFTSARLALACPVWEMEDPPIGKIDVKEVISENGINNTESTSENNDTLIFPAEHYPVQSRRIHECGVVIFSLEVAKDGSVISTKIIESPFERLSDYAKTYPLKRWKFPKPKLKHGEISVTKIFKAEFKLLSKNDGTEVSCTP